MNTKLSSSAKASEDRQKGQVSRMLIILAAVLLVMIGVVFGVLKLAANRRANVVEQQDQTANEPPKPVYETTLGEIRFLLESAIDLGPVIKAQTPYQQDIATTEKFIYLTIRAQNKGKADTTQFAWGMGNIIDSEGRNFIPDNNAYSFLPRPDTCGAILKPEFAPTPCTKIYQVSKVSEHLKVEVQAMDPNSSKVQTALLDLKVR